MRLAMLNEIRDLIDISIRYPIEAVHSTVSEKHPYSAIMYDVVNLEDYLSDFYNQLLERIGKSKSCKDVKIQIECSFFPAFDKYFEWYKVNKKKTKIFGSHNPYELIYNTCKTFIKVYRKNTTKKMIKYIKYVQNG